MATSEILNILLDAKKFGYKLQDDGTHLIGRVPHIAPEAYFHKIFSGISEEVIAKMANDLNCQIPNSYKQFLKKHNGLSTFSGSLYLYGYRKHYNRKTTSYLPFDIISPNVFEKPKDSTDNFFFIGGYNWDSSYLYIDRESLKIYRCDRDSVKPLNEWKNFDEFLLKEIKRLAKLFDKQGKENNPDTPTTPE